LFGEVPAQRVVEPDARGYGGDRRVRRVGPQAERPVHGLGQVGGAPAERVGEVVTDERTRAANA
jgi:hypothetical protein